jgi:predicted N-acyltransferase
MADREPDPIARIAAGVSEIDREEWNRLAGPSDPFLSHEYLSLLESSASVGAVSGWTPFPIMIEREGRLAAAAPAYLKSHSQGEYVFDHGWADAWERAGGVYYPKLQVAVPFTPCPGSRLLGSETERLLSAIEAVTVQNDLSSAHITFLEEQEADRALRRGWLERHGVQFHWFNRDYANFDDFLARLSSRKRKAIRKERHAACEKVEVVTLRGAEIGPDHWDAMWRFYQHTGARKWGRPYLSRQFFDRVGEAMGETALIFLAIRSGEAVAGALNFVGTDILYGRYWGATEDVPFLHFELSYYRAMEWAIANGIGCVQAGAQGEHKLARGYEPVLTRSVHFLPNAGFRDAVARFLTGEREAIRQEMEWARESLPYRSDYSA